MENPWVEAARKAAKIGINAQAVHNGDYFDGEILYCGVCKCQRRRYVEIKTGSSVEKILVKTECNCEKLEKERKRQEEEKKRLDEHIAYLLSESMMTETAKKARFSSFNETEENTKNLCIAKKYVQKFDELIQKSQGLLFFGNPGTGKSFLASCIANELIEKNHSVLMLTMAKALEVISSDNLAEKKLLEKVIRFDLVVFDDFGSERNTSYASEKVYNLVDTRYSSGKPMIVTTNIPLQSMMNEKDVQYTRVYDRIIEVCYPMHFKGESQRRKNAYTNFERMRALIDG